MTQSMSQEQSLVSYADTSFMFSNRKHVHKPRIEKRQRDLLNRLPILNSLLRPGERVLLVTTCCSPTPLLEQLTMGWIVFYINRALLVVTDQRLLHFPATLRYGYRESIAQIDYQDCADIRVRGRHLHVRYRNGKKERFLNLGKDRAKLKDYFAQLETPRSQEAAPANGKRRHLCPRCTSVLDEGEYQCGECRLTFKDIGTATRLSVLLPGGGYFYTGHWFLGLGDLFAEGVLLVLLIASLADAVAGEAGAWAVAIMLGVVLTLEKLTTVYHARRFVRERLPAETVEQQSSVVTG